MNPGDRITCPNGFGWVVAITGARVPHATTPGVILKRDHQNNPSPFEAGRWVSPDTLKGQYRPVEPDEGTGAVASALAQGLQGLDELRATQARRRAEGRI